MYRASCIVPCRGQQTIVTGLITVSRSSTSLPPIMPDVLINHGYLPLTPPSPASSATYIDCSSPGYKPRVFHMSTKGKYKFPPSTSEDELTIYGPSNSMLSAKVDSDVIPVNFLAQVGLCIYHFMSLLTTTYLVASYLKQFRHPNGCNKRSHFSSVRYL